VFAFACCTIIDVSMRMLNIIVKINQCIDQSCLEKRRCCKNRSDCSRNENEKCFALFLLTREILVWKF
jgi:hypothetical protein